MRVRLITRSAFGMFLGASVADYMRRSLVRRGVTIQEHTTIAAVRGGEAQTQAGTTIPFDLCLWTGGFAVPSLQERLLSVGVKENGLC